ncbi:63417cb2-a552-441d-b7d3-eb536d8ba481 [Thermothielavioides terrestris]|uniref:63417cb2-a552-441d-b7d3-eb536d8ba481 n=1 Tax=Thermothielavioides terrestris TaxID=2587410 RepID=A0A446BBX6_9PEZI|nr:63417cb2-a552-441d-b7d3-eb536d8ba481 [Thermothielavioides terrestris]
MDTAALPKTVALTAPRALGNVSAWRNFTLWTAQHFGRAVNVSRLAPSLEDLVWAGPRMVMKLGRLGSFISFPDAIDGFGQRVVPDPTDADHLLFSATVGPAGEVVEVLTESSAPASSVPMSAASAAAAGAASTASQDPNAFVSRFSMEGARGLGGVLSYATSKWALCCIAMAVILNRTHIFAATRRRLRLRWPIRLLMRIGPILLLLFQARRLLQSIQCQTSADFAELRWANASKSSDLMFSQKNGFLHGLSSSLLLGATDEQSCRSVKMIPWDDREQSELVGSLSRLWPLFGTLCLSQFIEVLSCAVQGRPVAAETGMTLFEHSLAFAEAEAAIGNQLGWGLFSNVTATSQAALGSKIALTRSMIMGRVNTPPEVLLVAFFSAMSHATSHILGVFNLQPKLRLVSTGFWGLCFMASIFWSALTFSVDDPSAQGLLRFPTVCIIGFIPHILILLGIYACGLVYAAALTLSAIATPEGSTGSERLSLRQRLVRAHANMQANVSLSDIRIRMDMDFYTALLRAGFGAITMASEAVYLNEDHQVNLKQYTWLEDDRFRELEELRMQWIGGGVPGSRFDSVGTIGLVPVKDVKDGQLNPMSGYAREKAAQQIPKTAVSGRRARDGVGAAERSSRWLVAFDYVLHIGRLALVVWALFTIRAMAILGLRTPPRWLRGLSQRPKTEPSSKKKSGRDGRGLNIDVLSAPGEENIFFAIPKTDQVDVEAELRRRMDHGPAVDDASQGNSHVDEAEVDSRLYSYFLQGGWWGDRDSSGDYAPPASRNPDDGTDDQDFEDTTSVISTTETASELDWESDHGEDETLDDGQRTPTQSCPAPTSFGSAVASTVASRESTPLLDTPVAAADLARLLDPQSPEDRDEARALAAHLSSDGIVTRSRFRQQLQRQRTQVLLTNKQAVMAHTAGQFGPHPPEKMTPEEEARVLEQLLLSRRRAAAASKAGPRPPPPLSPSSASSSPPSTSAAAANSTWATGAAGLGPDGPQCVVCQSAPRTIIVWPCRCLSLCDDCRVSLAMNNFDKCVCCRREVISFSRIYVP